MMLVAATCASGCATYRYGTHQAVAVVTDPPGASCRFERHGNVIARIDKTPGEASVERSIFITRLTCSRDDHYDETVELVTERAADLAARDPARLPDVVTDTVASAAYQVGSTYVTSFGRRRCGLARAGPGIAHRGSDHAGRRSVDERLGRVSSAAGDPADRGGGSIRRPSATSISPPGAANTRRRQRACEKKWRRNAGARAASTSFGSSTGHSPRGWSVWRCCAWRRPSARRSLRST